MGASSRRNRSMVGLLALVATAIFLLPASQAEALEFPNACVNNIIATQSSSIPVTMTANTSTAGPVNPGDPITLEEIKQELKVPPAVFIAGYNAGLLTKGVNKIPTKIETFIRGTNTEQETQVTNKVATEAETTITDPNGVPGTGDETATPGKVNVTYNNQTWTAGASGPINFREKTVNDPTRPSPPGVSITEAGIRIESVVAGAIKAKFGCDPGTVVEAADPSTISLETAPALASVAVNNTANRAPTAKAGPDQSVPSEAAEVMLNGSESSDSSEETFALHYEWKQTSGPSVTLNEANTMTPSFKAPEGPTSLTFELVKVCDNDASPLCSSSGDSVTITVNEPTVKANAGPDQTVDSGSSVTLDGSGSSAAKGEALTYEWKQTAGPSVTLSDSKAVTPTFTAPTGPVNLEFEMKVCKSKAPSLCAGDKVAIKVREPTPTPEPGNQAPNTKLKSAKIKGHKVTFTFSSNEKGSTFLCKLDKKKFAKCKSPKTYKNLKPGKHKFQVKARDSEGKVDPTPVVKKFRIEK